jgi:site-specific DNA-adenine methylase
MGEQLTLFGEIDAPRKQSKIVNVASVPQRSPFRYPGGKTWLIPTVRQWLKQEKTVELLIEPFAGGGIISLTAAFEDLSGHVVMVELNKEVAAVWEVILNGKNEWLTNKILHFELTHDVVFRKDIYNKEELSKLGLNERQIKAVLYVRENGKITNKKYQELNNTLDRTALRDIEELMNKDIFKREGDGKKTYYRI